MYKKVFLQGGGFKTEGYLRELLQIMDKTDYNTKFYGSSMGAFWAVSAAFGINTLINMIIDTKKYVEDVRISWLKNFGSCKNVMRQILQKNIPEDISIIQNRCFINLTKLSSKKPFLQPLNISTFINKEDLINATVSSMFVPLYSDKSFTNYFRGDLIIDGCLTENIPNKLDINCKVLQYKEKKKNLLSFLSFLFPVNKYDGIIIKRISNKIILL